MFFQFNKDMQLMAFYMTEVLYYNADYSLNNYYHNMIIYKNPLQEINELIQNFNTYKDDFQQFNYNKYIPAEINSLLYNQVNKNTTGLNNFGIYSGIINAIYEIQYIISVSDYNYYDNFMGTIYNAFDILESSSLVLDNQLNQNLADIFNIIIISTVLYSIISILLYIFVYLPYLKNESKKLQNIHFLSKYIRDERK